MLKAKDQRTVALAGNPNVGKSTLFNALTGLHQHTGNWPGKTVAVASGIRRQGDLQFHFVDLPGTYSLEGKSEEERLASEYLAQAQMDCTVVVCDGSCLERSLILALQILQRTGRVIVCVNLMDEAGARGITVDRSALEEALGVPVVLTAAGKKRGIGALMKLLQTVPEGQPRQSEDPIAEAEQIAAACVSRREGGSNWRTHLDKLLVSRRHGLPILFLLLLALIWLTVWGANYPSELLQRLFDRGYFALTKLLSGVPPWLRGILADGVYATSARVISVMLPPMAIFFPLFTLLEEIGYLPRMAFLLDHGMSRCGGCGKQALTMCMGLGCNAVGVTGCRILDSPRERLAAILTNAMVPCNGRFPTVIVLGSLFFPQVGAAFLVAACVALGVAGAMAVSGVLNKTVLRRETSTFVMEMPPFRRPRLGKILVRSFLDRTVFVAARALSVAAPAGAVLWILANTPLMGLATSALDPIGRALGMNGVLLLAFIFALPANELLIPVVLMASFGTGSLQSVAPVSALSATGMSWQMAVCAMVFTVFHWPCSTTLLTIYHETKSVKKTAAGFFLPTAVGIVLCAMLNLLL